MKIEYFKSILESLGKNTITVGIIIAVIPNLIQNNINLKTERQIQSEAKTVELFTKKYEKESNLGEIINELNRDLDLSEALKILTEDTIKEHYEFTKNFTIKDQDRYKNMLIITDYYNAIASCVKSGLCDKKTAEDLFKEEGANFFRTYYPFFCYFKDRWHDSLIKEYSVDFYDLKKLKDSKSKDSKLTETCNKGRE